MNKKCFAFIFDFLYSRTVENVQFLCKLLSLLKSVVASKNGLRKSMCQKWDAAIILENVAADFELGNG
jgi:hypothetical protein